MSGVLAWVGLVVGVALVLSTLVSVVLTLVVPRGGRSFALRAVHASVGRTLSGLVLRLSSYETRDRLLALLGPVELLSLLLVWLGLFLGGFALVLWPLVGSIGEALTVSGSSMFTLGFAAAHGAAPVAVVFCASATGLISVALLISYLPTLYAAFNRRETLVTMLESRGGAPVWGPEILARHHLVDIVDSLPQLYIDWERWAADVAESHSNYPILVLFRSPDPLRSWLTSLLAVLDAAALHLAMCPLSAPSECRLVLRMGFTALRDVAAVVGIPFDPDPRPDDPLRLSRDEFDEAVSHCVGAGFRLEASRDDAWTNFSGWRVNYESVGSRLALEINAPPALWSGPRRRAEVGVRTAPRRPEDRRPPRRQRLLAERQVLQANAVARQAARRSRMPGGVLGRGHVAGDDDEGRAAPLAGTAPPRGGG